MFRNFLMVCCMLVALPFAASNASAASADDARQHVDSVGKKVLEVVNGSAAEAQKQQQLRQLFTDNVDIDWMGRFVLGAAWSKATEDQRTRYLQAYREYLLARYTTNFADYAGSNYTITGAKNESEGQFTVSMQVKSPNASQQDTLAGYRVRAADGGGLKIVDIIIEGVSLITTQRSEFASVVQKDGMDKLITQLQGKTQSKTD